MSDEETTDDIELPPLKATAEELHEMMQAAMADIELILHRPDDPHCIPIECIAVGLERVAREWLDAHEEKRADQRAELRMVLEALHTPMLKPANPDPNVSELRPTCRECASPWPCATIRALRDCDL